MNGMWMPGLGGLPEATAQAGRVDALAFGLFWLNALMVVTLFGLVVGFAIYYRRGAQVDRTGKVAERTVEIAWTLALLGVFLGIFFWAARLYIEEEASPALPGLLEIRGVGKQWMWKFQHPGGQREINELHLPLGQPVKLVLATQDVIHSFYVPAFRIKQDVVPGRWLALSFTPGRVGRYRLFCAEYCGLDHARMTGEVVVLEPADYRAWLEASGDTGAMVEREVRP